MILLDLFSGIGGFHKGLADAGFEFSKVYFSEVDKYAIANYKNNYKNAQNIGTIEHVLDRGMERPNIITFGSPCQDFSLAGKRKGLAGDRSSLVEYALAAVANFRPDFYIWENVKGTFSSNAGADFWAIIQALANIRGYRIEWQLLNTAWVLPQNRERVYLVGRLADKCRGGVFPLGEDDTILKKQGNPGQRRTQTKHCGTTLTGGALKATDTYVKVGTWRTHKDGRGFREIEGGNCPTIPARAREDGSGQPVIKLLSHYGHKDKAPREHKISPTLKAEAHGHQPMVTVGAIRGRSNQDGTPGKTSQRLEVNKSGATNTLTSVEKDNVVINEDFKIRRLTEIECERLQGFPDNWTQYGDFDGEIKKISATQRYKMLGNAVTAKIVEAVGVKILKTTDL